MKVAATTSLLAALAIAASAHAQTTVYECQTSHGTVYSDQPCANPHSKRMKKLELQPDHVSDAQATARTKAAEDYLDEQDHQDDPDQKQSECFAKLTRSNDFRRKRIKDDQSQIDKLRKSGDPVPNMLGVSINNDIGPKVRQLQARIDALNELIRESETYAKTTCADQRDRGKKIGKQGKHPAGQ